MKTKYIFLIIDHNITRGVTMSIIIVVISGLELNCDYTLRRNNEKLRVVTKQERLHMKVMGDILLTYKEAIFSWNG